MSKHKNSPNRHTTKKMKNKLFSTLKFRGKKGNENIGRSTPNKNGKGYKSLQNVTTNK